MRTIIIATILLNASLVSAGNIKKNDLIGEFQGKTLDSGRPCLFQIYRHGILRKLFVDFYIDGQKQGLSGTTVDVQYSSQGGIIWVYNKNTGSNERYMFLKFDHNAEVFSGSTREEFCEDIKRIN